MKLEAFKAELEKIVEELGYEIRKEKGSFRGDFCVLEGDKLVMMNKNYPTEFHIGQIVRFLGKQDLDTLYIKPAVRKALDEWLQKFKEKETE